MKSEEDDFSKEVISDWDDIWVRWYPQKTWLTFLEVIIWNFHRDVRKWFFHCTCKKGTHSDERRADKWRATRNVKGWLTHINTTSSSQSECAKLVWFHTMDNGHIYLVRYFWLHTIVKSSAWRGAAIHTYNSLMSEPLVCRQAKRVRAVWLIYQIAMTCSAFPPNETHLHTSVCALICVLFPSHLISNGFWCNESNRAYTYPDLSLTSAINKQSIYSAFQPLTKGAFLVYTSAAHHVHPFPERPTLCKHSSFA